MQSFGQDKLVYYGAISLYELYNISPEYVFGVNATNVTSVKIYSDFLLSSSDQYGNILLYEMNKNAQGTFVPTQYNNPQSLGVIGQDYPSPWVSNDMKSSAFAAKRYYLINSWEKVNPDNVFEDFLGSAIPVRIEISRTGTITNLTLPGIGYVYKDGAFNRGLRFDTKHPCHTTKDAISDEWYYIKNPSTAQISVDLKLAAHRGYWGYNLGNGPIENTEPSIAAAKNYTNIIEVDVMITKDKEIVVSHDFTLPRLTNSTDDGNIFIFNVNYNDIKNLSLRKRNFNVDPNFKFITYSSMIDFAKKYNTILTVDIKEIGKRTDPASGTCTAECDITPDMQRRSWVELLSRIIQITSSAQAWKYVAVKTPYTLNDIKQYLPSNQYDDLHKLLFFPIAYGNRGLDYCLKYINDWYNNAPNYLMGMHTNFLNSNDVILQPFSTYKNLLHYVVAQTLLRPGLYSEEPTGPKGCATRYSQWNFKNAKTDYRADPLWLMSIPYFDRAIVTADRVDIWKDINDAYKPSSLNSPEIKDINNK
jgi:hypothetical protein